MRSRIVDPRDQRSEDDSPCYRVFFWEASTACEEWQLEEVDLDEVLTWIEEHADGRSHSLWVMTRPAGELHGVRLRGIDPPDPSSTWPAWAHEVR